MRVARYAGAALLAACVTPAPQAVTGASVGPTPALVRPDPSDAPRAALRRFVTAATARDFAQARELLGRAWRERLDAARLERDFDREPLAAHRLRRIEARLGEAFALDGGSAALPLGDGLAVELGLEPDGWRVLRLE